MPESFPGAIPTKQEKSGEGAKAKPAGGAEKAQASGSEIVQSERSFSIEAFEPYRPTGAWVSGKEKRQGDDSVRDPPLPIPNREVKPHRADGTAKVGE